MDTDKNRHSSLLLNQYQNSPLRAAAFALVFTFQAHDSWNGGTMVTETTVTFIDSYDPPCSPRSHNLKQHSFILGQPGAAEQAVNMTLTLLLAC